MLSASSTALSSSKVTLDDQPPIGPCVMPRPDRAIRLSDSQEGQSGNGSQSSVEASITSTSSPQLSTWRKTGTSCSFLVPSGGLLADDQESKPIPRPIRPRAVLRENSVSGFLRPNLMSGLARPNLMSCDTLACPAEFANSIHCYSHSNIVTARGWAVGQPASLGLPAIVRPN
jgi:hypothetical protein